MQRKFPWKFQRIQSEQDDDNLWSPEDEENEKFFYANEDPSYTNKDQPTEELKPFYQRRSYQIGFLGLGLLILIIAVTSGGST